MTVTNRLAVHGGTPAVSPTAHRRWPDIVSSDRDAVMGVLDRGILSAGTALDAGRVPPEIGGLERDFAQYLGVEHCLSLNTGTAALHCCVAAAGIGPGDEVIVPAFSFVATALAVVHQGASPVFCDIDPDTYNLDPTLLPDLLTRRTRAVMPVHIHGLPADMDTIIDLAQAHRLAVIEDAAQAHGAKYRGRKVGTLGDSAGFSLNVAKNLSGGEGGLFVTDDPEANLIARRLTNFGEDMPPPGYLGRHYWSHGIGWNYRNQELSAALARSQLRRLDGYNDTARRNAGILSAGLAGVPGAHPPSVPGDRESVFHIYRLRLDADALGYSGAATVLRDRVIEGLRAEGVAAGIWQHHPLPAHPAFRRRPTPWHRAADREPLRPWHPAEYPETVRLLQESLVLGSGVTPLQVQTTELMEQYVEAVAKVLGSVDELPPARERSPVDSPTAP